MSAMSLEIITNPTHLFLEKKILPVSNIRHLVFIESLDELLFLQMTFRKV